MNSERKCKGSVMLDMVKVVRAFKDLPWDRHLEPDDWEIVNSMVMPTEWYPIESYMRIGMAVYKLVAKEDEETVKNFGRAATRDLLESSYRPFLDKNDPFQAVGKYLDLRKPLFNFYQSGIRKTGEKSLQVRIFDFGDIAEGLDIFLLLLGVQIEEIIKFNGGKEIKLQTGQEVKEGEKVLVVDLDWI